MTAYICIGVPYWIGERIEARSEVYTMRDSGIVAELGAEWVEVAPDFAAFDNPLMAVNRALAESISTHADRLPLIFASDCVSALGAMKGLERHAPDILWYDSHGDFNTPETTPSGFLGGMPLAALVGRGNPNWLADMGLRPTAENKVTLTDARNLDPEEGELVRSSQVRHLPDINQLYGVTWGDRPLYIHLDSDVIDSAEMPALSYPEPGGPTVEQTAATVRQVVKSARVAGMLFTLWNDSLPGADRAQAAVLRLVRAAVG